MHEEQFTEEDLREMVLRLAHEIRNPLATIKSGVQLVQHLTKPTGEIGEYLESVLAEVSRIDFTVRDMQQYVRLAPGRSRRVQVAEVVAGAIETCADEARRAGVTVVPSGSQGVRALIDPDHFRLALVELAANAVSFSPSGSSVRISWSSPEAGRVPVHVDDQCSGIPTDVGERMLRPFFSTSTSGTGLGLSKVLKICALAGGSLSWKNLAGRGCRFTLLLPEG